MSQFNFEREQLLKPNPIETIRGKTTSFEIFIIKLLRFFAWLKKARWRTRLIMMRRRVTQLFRVPRHYLDSVSLVDEPASHFQDSDGGAEVNTSLFYRS